ncbi:hypothetical protein [Paenibacillus sp. FSL K6-0108]|uniref:hypothetical protein n=1 Tax=Paenibacillus sp. FSL K6-0108 TaxID=2921417 RepID=UPI00324A7898
MSTLYDQAMEEMIAVIHEWFDEQMKRDDLEQAVKRTTLQMGSLMIFCWITDLDGPR